MNKEIAFISNIETKKDLCDSVIESLKQEVQNYVDHLSFDFDYSDSPIEQMLSMGFKTNEFRGFHYKYLNNLFDVLDIRHQVTIDCEGLKKSKPKKYRADFLIELASMEMGSCYKFVVECDGYEFHSDKESFSKDRERDMILLLNGYITIRCSGREILGNPHKCAANIFKTIYNFVINENKNNSR